MNASPPRVLTQTDFDRFAALSRDDNPIHCDPAFARATHFGATVAHGMFLFSLLCARMARQQPESVLPVGQTLMFPLPTFVADGVEAVLVPQEAHGGNLLGLETSIRCVERGGRPLREGEQPVTALGEALLMTEAHAGALALLPPQAEAGEAAPSGDAALYHLRPGQQAEAGRAFSTADIDEYVSLTGDASPFHADPAFARRRGFDGAIVPLQLLAGMFSDLLGTRLPGRGTGWMKQSLRLCSAARLGEPLTASVRIVRLRADKDLVNLASLVTGSDGRVVVQGESLVLVRNLEDKGEARAA
jgi:acyl dehydratase